MPRGIPLLLILSLCCLRAGALRDENRARRVADSVGRVLWPWWNRGVFSAGEDSRSDALRLSADAHSSYTRHHAGRRVCARRSPNAVPRHHGEQIRLIYTEFAPSYYSCCPGWAQVTRVSFGCNRPTCSGACFNGGVCASPGRCSCPKGYTGDQCQTDVDECLTEKPCGQLCRNLPGTYECLCRPGYILQPDGQSCRRNGSDDTAFEARDLERDFTSTVEPLDVENEVAVFDLGADADQDYEVILKRLSKLEMQLAKGKRKEEEEASEMSAKLNFAIETINEMKRAVDNVQLMQQELYDARSRMKQYEMEARKIRHLTNRVAELESRLRTRNATEPEDDSSEEEFYARFGRSLSDDLGGLSIGSPRVGGPLSQSLAMIPPTMHGHEFNQPLSRVVMVRKTDQRTFSKGRRGGEPLLETVTRETVELFNGGRAERKYTSETRDIVTPKSNSMPSLSVNGTRKKVVGFVDQLSPERSRAESVRSKSPLTASPASPGPLSNSLHGSFHGSLGSDGMSCSSARSSSASPDSARYAAATQITKTDTRKPSVRRSGPPKEFINVCLDTHNFYRARHGAPPLRLSKQLCKTSQDWANILAARGRLEHRANIEYGENLYCMWSSNPKTVVGGDEPVNEWYAEEVQHQYGKEPTTLKTGHFTQVVWRDSTELGVGMARNRNGEVYVVCNYNPAGNFLGSFVDNVQPPCGSSPSKRLAIIEPKQESTLDEQSWQQEALLVHNEYRRRHRVPELRLNPELTAAAKAWANTLLTTNKLVHQSTSPYGENIYSMQSSDPKLIVSAREVVSKWYSEKKDHKFGTEPKVLNTCHFTQIVWRSTSEMGIALAKKDGTCVVVACYHPRGNIVGHFAENVPKAVKSVS